MRYINGSLILHNEKYLSNNYKNLELKSASSRENIIEAIKFYYLAALQGDLFAIAKLQTGSALHTTLENFSKERISSSYFSWSNSASVQTQAIYWLGKLFASDFLFGKKCG